MELMGSQDVASWLELILLELWMSDMDWID